jgi:hypothetical protein
MGNCTNFADKQSGTDGCSNPLLGAVVAAIQGGDFFMAEKGRVVKRKNPFIQIDRRPIEDPRLSWKATGLMTYFVSKPDNWEFHMEHIIKSKTDGEKAVRSGINELKETGYIVRVAFRKDGKVKDYEFFVYEEPVQYPTTKDLHIDLDLWEKYLEEHKDDDLIDVTVAALEIKEMKEKRKQVSQNRQPEKNQEVEQVSQNRQPEKSQEVEQVSQNRQPEKSQGVEQVSQNGKPEGSQGIEQVSQNQHPAYQHPENAGLSYNHFLSISNLNQNYDDDPQYLQLRIMFMREGGQDIKKHDQHYQTFLRALSEIGSFDKMKELAEKYILSVKEKKYHESPQIVWFISDGWRNFHTPKLRKMIKTDKQQQSKDNLPEALKMAQDKTQQPKQNDIDRETKERIIRLKQDLMNARFALRDAEKHGKPVEEINRLSAHVEQLEKEIEWLESGQKSA